MTVTAHRIYNPWLNLIQGRWGDEGRWRLGVGVGPNTTKICPFNSHNVMFYPKSPRFMIMFIAIDVV